MTEELLAKQLIAFVTDCSNAITLIDQDHRVAAAIILQSRIEKAKFMFKDMSEKNKEFNERMNNYVKEMDSMVKRAITPEGGYFG